MAELYDVVIVGAGPAGAMAAKVAGENGLKAALIERKKDTSVIRRICTMIINIDERNYEEYIHYDYRNKRFVFPYNGFSVKYEGRIEPIYGFHIVTPGGGRVELGNVETQKKLNKPVGVQIDKGFLCQSMIDEAVDMGVELYNNTNITNIRKESDCVVVTDNRGDEYHGKFIIAADGVNSRIVRCLGLDKERTFLGTYKDMARTYVGAEVPGSEALLFGMGWDCSISFAPEIEKGHYHVAGASYNVACDIDSIIDKVLVSEPYATWFKNAKEIEGHRTSCVSHIAVPLQMPFKDNVVLVGDAGWMQEISNPGAIMMGWKAAHSITEALIDKEINAKGVKSYIDWYEKYMFQPVGKRMAASGGADMKDFLTAEDVDYMASLVKNPLTATMNFFVMFKTIGTTFAELLPRIGEERPDVMQKLMAYRSHPRALALAQRMKEGHAIRS
jgi:flavin-dependent dehydrogenase